MARAITGPPAVPSIPKEAKIKTGSYKGTFLVTLDLKITAMLPK